MASAYTDNQRQLLLGLLEVGARSKERAALRASVPIAFSTSTASVLEQAELIGRVIGRRHDLDQLFLTPAGVEAARGLVRELTR